MKFAVHTLGCKVNQYETEQIIRELKGRGAVLVDFEPGADLYIVNSCFVTTESEKKSRKLLGKAKRFTSGGGKTVFTGCYASKFAREYGDDNRADFIISQEKKEKLVEVIAQSLDLGQVCTEEVHLQVEHTRALIKIQDGCSYLCSYCAVPLARGIPRSRPLAEILTETKKLVEAGVKELVITGINLGLYGSDLSGDLNLEVLLKKIVDIDEHFRLRLSSLEPYFLTYDFIDYLAVQKKICRHLHIPLQSGSDKILNSMNRPYRATEFQKRINYALEKIPGLAVTTDVMVGFPRETENDFQKTVKLINQLKLRKLHVFRYSPRPGTEAIKLEETVTSEEKRRRSSLLLRLNKEIEESFIEEGIGQKEMILVEKETDQGILTGLSDNYVRFKFPGSRCIIGKLQEVKGLKREGILLLGQIS